MRSFGVEVEFVSPLSGEKLEEELVSLGQDVKYIEDPEELHSITVFWKIVPDDSIPSKLGQHSLELVSPILSWDSFIDLKPYLEYLKSVECFTKYTCGLHIHVDISDWRDKKDVNEFYDLIMAVLLNEVKIIKLIPIKRRPGHPASRFCRTIGLHYNNLFRKPITSTVEERKTLLEKCLRFKAHKVWAPREDKFNRKRVSSNVLMRNTLAGLNFLRLWDFGTVEFRYAESTLEFDIIKKWTNLYMQLIEQKEFGDKYKELEGVIEVEKQETYRPLPKGVTIKKSNIEGLGLFVTENFEMGYNFGPSHVGFSGPRHIFEGTIVRTPLGGFINHSEEPNCRITDQELGVNNIVSLRKIDKGEELTTYYTLYDIID